MNFNFSNQAEYTLNTQLTTEMINLYGVLTKFIKTEKINFDMNVFGDYSHMKTNNSDIYDIYMLPETTEDWDTGSYGFNNFGLVNFDNITLFVSKSSFDGILEPQQIVNNLIVFPNNKVMEITDIDLTTPGVNNLFTYSDAKNVYKLVCKPYDFKIINEIDQQSISPDQTNYESLDVYFNELINDKTAQDTSAEITPSVDTVDSTSGTDVKVEKPIIDKTESSVWGDFE